MKSYLLIASDFIKTGGMDRANFAVADYLGKQGQDVYLVAHQVATDLLVYPNVKFRQVPKIANSNFLSSPLLDWIGRSLARRLAVEGSRVLVNGGNCQWPDVNWVHYVHAAYEAKNQVGLLYQLKEMVSHRIFLDEERKALRSAQVIIVNSDRTKQDLIEKLAIPEQKLHRVYYGIDPQKFYPATPEEKAALRQQLGWSADKAIVVFIGALGDRRKGFDTLFTAWQNLCSSPNWNAELVVIGVGAELPLWQRRADVAGIHNIHFLGFRSDVPDLLRAADCLVAPTRYEAYGLGVHEAISCGLPSIVSANAGVAERYPPHLSDLLLPDCEDTADLTAKLHRWREGIDHYRKQLSSFSEELRSYTWDDMAKNILATIETDG